MTTHHLPALLGLASLGATLLVGVAGAPAEALSCGGGVRYATSSNAIYLTEAKAYTPSSIVAACPSAPLKQVDAANKTWLLSADLVVQNGATLALTGAAAGGDVNTLRIRSRASNDATQVQAVTAQYGTIAAKGVTVTSWDDEAGHADELPDYVTGPGVRGRAFVRAISFTDAAGVAHQSRLTIEDSTFTQLGYYAAESYGISYKTRECSRANVAACHNAPVTGWQKNSTFSKNYMGVYLWGAQGMEFSNNRYVDNVMYGWDGHDVSTDMTVVNNRFEGNGDHGWICSQLCDKLLVTGNVASRNGMVPWSGPNPDEPQSGQVHGMMLHRGVTNTLLENNTVTDNPNGAGIAIFDSEGAVVRNNTVKGAKYGIRLSVGAHNNLFDGNVVTGSTAYAVFAYAGTDEVAYMPSQEPSANVFTHNTFEGSGDSVVKMTDVSATRFADNVFSQVTTPIELTRAASTVFTGNTMPSGQLFVLRGSADSPTQLSLAPKTGVRIDRDAYSTVS